MPDLSTSPSAGANARLEGEQAYQRARVRLAEQDLEGSAHWLEQAAALGHPAGLTELAILYLHGFGRDVDAARATDLLLQAETSGGTPETSYLLAQVAIGGVALPRDPSRIDAWIADSARRGHPPALRVAGLAFGRRSDGAGQRAAAHCLRRAMQARDPVAAALFADRLDAGCGVARDHAQARQLANQLLAIGIQVQLAMTAPDIAHDVPTLAGDVEPPWSELECLSGALPPVHRHCTDPEVVTCDGLLSDEECRFLVYSGARFVERSEVIHPVTGQALKFGVRTSRDMVFFSTLDDPGVRMLQHRMALLAGFELGNTEPLAMLRYGPGEQYHPHRDYFFPSAPQLAQPGGQRHSTVCTYLNDVPRGGETVFPDKDVIVSPRRGRAVMFRNLLADGSPDIHSLHAGMPVIEGEKWLASCWIRANTARSF